MSPTARRKEKNGKKHRAEGLHAEKCSQRAEAARRGSREKIRTAPGQRRGQAKENAHLLGGLALHGEPEFCHHFLQVFPYVGFCRRIAEKIRRMIGDH